MAKDMEFYKQYVLDCFSRQETGSLLIMSIVANAGDDLEAEDLPHIVPAVRELEKEGKLRPEDARGYLRLR